MECLSSRREREAPGGRARENRKFIQAPSPEIWSETISGGEEVLAGKWGGLFLPYLLGKNFRRRDRDHLVPPRRMDAAVCRAEVCYPFGPKHGKASGSETARVHNVARQRGCVAGRGASAAADDAGDRVPPDRCARWDGAHDGSLSPWAERSRLCGGPKRRGRISLCGWSIRPIAHAGSRLCPPPGSFNRRLWPACRTGG